MAGLRGALKAYQGFSWRNRCAFGQIAGEKKPAGAGWVGWFMWSSAIRVALAAQVVNGGVDRLHAHAGLLGEPVRAQPVQFDRHFKRPCEREQQGRDIGDVRDHAMVQLRMNVGNGFFLLQLQTMQGLVKPGMEISAAIGVVLLLQGAQDEQVRQRQTVREAQVAVQELPCQHIGRIVKAYFSLCGVAEQLIADDKNPKAQQIGAVVGVRPEKQPPKRRQ